ncbi:MAG: hypothetical protein AAF170_13410, partial [Bacteroidota bacterium]
MTRLSFGLGLALLALLAFTPPPTEQPTHTITFDYQEMEGERRMATVRIERREGARRPWRGRIARFAVQPADGGAWVHVSALRADGSRSMLGTGQLPGPDNIGAIAFETSVGERRAWTAPEDSPLASKGKKKGKKKPKEDPPEDDPDDPEDPEDPEDPDDPGEEEETPCEWKDPWTGDCVDTGDMKDPWEEDATSGTIVTIE